MAKTYTANQIYDSLIRQGVSEAYARTIANNIGAKRISEAQLRSGYDKLGMTTTALPAGSDGKIDTSFAPNLGEGLGFTAGYELQRRREAPVAEGEKPKKIRKGIKRFGVGGIGGLVGGVAGEALSGTNFYDRASDDQLYADVGGSIAGGYLGEKIGNRLGAKTKALPDTLLERAPELKRPKVLKSVLLKQPALKAAAALPTRLLGSTAGRALGTGLGSALGPAGAILGGAIGGTVLPMFFSPDSTAVEDEEEENNYSNPFGG